jgi:hypothetical protein
LNGLERVTKNQQVAAGWKALRALDVLLTLSAMTSDLVPIANSVPARQKQNLDISRIFR